MVADTAVANEASEVSPYTRAMVRCLRHRPADAEGVPPAPARVHELMNLVQGRMLEFLADRICEVHGIGDPQARQAIVSALLGIFSDEFFALFRSKMAKRPDLAVLIARRIIRSECEPHAGPLRRRAVRLFPAIFRKYFEYRNLDSLLHMVESDAEIQKIILVSALRRRVQRQEPEFYREVVRIVEEDREGICPNLFLEYLSQDRLEERIRSGEWRHEMEGLKKKIAVLCGD